MARHAELTHTIIGVFYDVYNELGYGFIESVYEKAMILALSSAGLNAEYQKPVQVLFRGNVVGDFRADIVVNELVLVELKSAETIHPPHIAQTINYLKATRMEVGLILNFGPKPEMKRLVSDL